MVMVPDAGKMHFRHSDQQNSSGGGSKPPHGLRNFGARRVGLHTTWSAPKSKILATPLIMNGCQRYNTERRPTSAFIWSCFENVYKLQTKPTDFDLDFNMDTMIENKGHL